jgi:DNA-binding transcriptional regulator YdaS (Cro superfamily)
MAGMTLKEYLRASCQTQSVFAERIGVSLGGLAKWLNGQRIPSARQMKAIVRATHGVVMPNDFFPEYTASDREAAE